MSFTHWVQSHDFIALIHCTIYYFLTFKLMIWTKYVSVNLFYAWKMWFLTQSFHYCVNSEDFDWILHLKCKFIHLDTFLTHCIWRKSLSTFFCLFETSKSCHSPCTNCVNEYTWRNPRLLDSFNTELELSTPKWCNDALIVSKVCSVCQIQTHDLNQVSHSALQQIWIKGSYLSQWLPQGESGPPKESK